MTGHTGQRRRNGAASSPMIADAEYRPVEAEQRRRPVQVGGHVNRQGHLERTVEQVEHERQGEQAGQHRGRPDQRPAAPGGG
jgi:hypothetical protein